MVVAESPSSQAHPLYAPNRACTACSLRQGCAGPVPGVGQLSVPITALSHELSPYREGATKIYRVMLIGEGPGKTEDEKGIPWTGQAGQYLDSLLESIGLSSEQVYLTNLVKCRPPSNRDPKPEEVAECAPRWLHAEILMVRPDIIVTLGAFATHYITGWDDTMEHLHAKPLETTQVLGIGISPIVLPIYHPASALHAGEDGGTARMRQIQDGFNVLKALMEGAAPESFTPVDQHPEPIYGRAEEEWDIVVFWEAAKDIGGVVTADTEVVDGALWSVQLSCDEGTALLIPAALWEQYVESPKMGKWRGGFPEYVDIVVHNWPYDAQWVTPPAKAIDTMTMAYLLGLPQSLKTLARDLCGMEMKSYDDTVRPYRREKAIAYLTEAAGTDWGPAEPVTGLKWVNKDGRLLEKGRQPQPINKKINRILKDAAKELDPADPWERWHKIDARERSRVESGQEGPEVVLRFKVEGIGPMPDAGVNDLSPEEELAYSARDADATLRVYNALRPLITEAGLDNVLQMDLGILPIIREQMDTGMPVNVLYLKELSEQFQQAMYGKAEEAAFQAGVALRIKLRDKGLVVSPVVPIVPYRFNPASTHQVARLLYDTVDGLGYPVTKKTPTGLPSTDDDELHKVGSKDDSGTFQLDPIIPPTLSYRENLKLKSTYSDGLQRLAARSPSGTRAHADMTTTRSETGRIIVKDGIHGIPVRTELGRQIRTAFLAEPGWTLLAADYSQIEMRVGHDRAGCVEGIKLFREGRDIHAETSAWINGIPLDTVMLDEYKWRRPMKGVGFGVWYGLTKYGLHNQMLSEGYDPLEWSEDRCGDFIKDYLKLYPEITTYHDSIKAAGRRYGYVVDMWGRRRFTPELKSPIRRIKLVGERQAINMPVQSGAQGIIKLAMVKLWERWNSVRLRPSVVGDCYDPPKDSLRWLIQYHDELIFEAKIGTELAWAAILVEVMESVVELSVPIIAEAKSGPDWGHMTKIKVGA